MARVEFNVKYTLIGPDGTTAVFNDPSDPNYVGVLSEITGLDSPDVRESADDLVEMDGGIHGDFFYGRRPIVLNGVILNPSSASARNARMDLLSRASDAMRGDAVLTWQPSGSVPQYVRVRRQQPLRVTGGWQKQFQLPLVAADPRIYSLSLNTSTVFTSDILGTNLVPNPSFEVDTSGWNVSNSSGVIAGTFARAVGGGAGWPASGVASLRVTGTNAADTTARRVGAATSTGTSGFPVLPNTDYYSQVQLSVNNGIVASGSNGFRMFINWYQASGAVSAIQSGTFGSFTSFPGIGPLTISVQGTAPSDAAFAGIVVDATVNTVSDFVDFHMDAAIFTPGTYLPYGYFDGNDPRGARWTGPTNQSASQLLPPTAGRTYGKTYNISYAAAAPLGQLLVTNGGTSLTYPVIRIYGPGNNPKIYNFTTGKIISLVYSLGAGDWLTIDTLNRTVLLNDSTSRYSAVDFVNTAWWGLAPGVNDLRIAFDTYIAGSALRVDWRDAWI
jgi:hypothetical protein